MKNCRQGLVVAFVVVVLLGSGCRTEPQREPTHAERKAEARAMVQEVLDTWEWRTWNQLLAEDVVLALKLGSIGLGSAVGVSETYTGRDMKPEDNGNVSGKHLARDFPVQVDPLRGLDGHPLTQFELARAGIVTKEMVYIAHRENLGPPGSSRPFSMR